MTLIAAQRPTNFLVRAVNMLCQIAGILVIIAAAWLVWTRPSAMSWGFFLYVNWFNPGQVYAFYAILAQWPLALLAQDVAAVLAQAAGYAGFLLFVLRVPNNKTEARWRPVERALPFVAVALALVLLASYGAVFGHPTEMVTRASILVGFAVAAAALAILPDAPALANAAGLSARALGDLGLPDRPAVVPARRTCLDHDDLRDALGRLHAE